jgi:hypothetical protein
MDLEPCQGFIEYNAGTLGRMKREISWLAEWLSSS